MTNSRDVESLAASVRALESVVIDLVAVIHDLAPLRLAPYLAAENPMAAPLPASGKPRPLQKMARLRRKRILAAAVGPAA